MPTGLTTYEATGVQIRCDSVTVWLEVSRIVRCMLMREAIENYLIMLIVTRKAKITGWINRFGRKD